MRLIKIYQFYIFKKIGLKTISPDKVQFIPKLNPDFIVNIHHLL
jgi:hypothetical protein